MVGLPRWIIGPFIGRLYIIHPSFLEVQYELLRRNQEERPLHKNFLHNQTVDQRGALDK